MLAHPVLDWSGPRHNFEAVPPELKGPLHCRRLSLNVTLFDPMHRYRAQQADEFHGAMDRRGLPRLQWLAASELEDRFKGSGLTGD